MEIVVNDTNIFIDLCSVGLLEQTFKLSLGIHTVDFVINELREDQRAEVLSFHDEGQLKVYSFSGEELLSVLRLKSEAGGNVSVTDCAAWHYAKSNGYTLVTGDAQLRKKAIASAVPVRGILYLFDMMVQEGVITKPLAAYKLEELHNINPRLPQKEMEERIEAWRG